MSDTLSSHDSDKTRELALNTVSGRVSGLAGALWLVAIVVGAVGFYLALGRAPPLRLHPRLVEHEPGEDAQQDADRQSDQEDPAFNQ